jgi:hypothetical protein
MFHITLYFVKKPSIKKFKSCHIHNYLFFSFEYRTKHYAVQTDNPTTLITEILKTITLYYNTYNSHQAFKLFINQLPTSLFKRDWFNRNQQLFEYKYV